MRAASIFRFSSLIVQALEEQEVSSERRHAVQLSGPQNVQERSTKVWICFEICIYIYILIKYCTYENVGLLMSPVCVCTYVRGRQRAIAECKKAY